MPIDCAAYSKKKEKWYGRSILFQAESLPAGAVSVELPDYEALRKADRDKGIEEMREEKEAESREEAGEGEAAEEREAAENREAAESREEALTVVDMEDGAYTVSLDFSGGSGRAFVESPAVLFVREGKAYVRLLWSSPDYDYMKVGGEKYLPVNDE